MFRSLVLPAVAIVVAGLVAAWWISRRGAAVIPEAPPGTSRVGPPDPGVGTSPPPPPADPPFSVLFAGEFDGRIWVPPCSSSGDGGLQRIGSAVIEANSMTPTGLVVSTGNFVSGPGALGGVEYDVALTVLREAGMAVCAVGERDLALGLQRWRDVKNRAGAGVAVICANLRDGQGRPLVPGWSSLRPGNRRIVCVATLSPSFAPGLARLGVGVTLLDPLAAAREALAEAGAADFRILISHAPRAESEALAAALPEIDITITAHAGDLPSLDAERIGDRVFVAAGRGWRNIGRAVFGPPGDRLSLLEYSVRNVSRALEAATQIGFHEMRALDEYRAPRFFEGALAERAGSAQKGEVYTGDGACASCHPTVHAAWRTVEDPHFRSMDRVRDRRLDRAPQCLPCHTTAAGFPGGHATPGDAMARVSCEACHGPGVAHVESGGSTPLRAASSSCTACHTPEMSPAFDFPSAWERVNHGE